MINETTITFQIHTFEIPSKRMKIFASDTHATGIGLHMGENVEDGDYCVFQDEDDPERRLIGQVIEHFEGMPEVWVFRICGRGE
jgi:hypothetical protein